ncbi:hypothetical protein MSBRW_3394 [Methanosarcina barkeri str. Wiesmoor]|uniref:Uncharacterized protein n=2 Tax=Methanosarcina barkeri TaxID=2208 RepID=A0A0E3QQ22_METBA|nr:hypothetical protein [Methanosarcina barkeri]AKB52647.1 hypothetical protein MSBRW_3394 [Methanosarcina barkeri str. Wiesmoor]
MALPPLKDRSRGYEFAASEYNLIFRIENTGYVRYKDKEKGIFYLDPSPYYNDPRNQIYVVKSGEFPPKDKLVEVAVTETETFYGLKEQKLDPILVKYIIGWKNINPNKIRAKDLASTEEFLEFLSTPVKNPNFYNIEDFRYCLGMCAISAPQITDLEKGGVNTVALDTHRDRQKWAAFKRILGIVPQEFRRPSSKNFYKFLENNEEIYPLNSREVNLSYFDVTDVPIHLPIPLNMAFKTYGEYKKSFEEYLPIARAYMVNSLLFQPYVPEKVEKRMENAMYFILDEISSREDIPYYQDIGSVIPKLATSFARLNFKSWVTLNDLKTSTGLWSDVMDGSRHNVSELKKMSTNSLYRLPSEAEVLLKEITELDDAGIPLLLSTVRSNTKLFDFTFDNALRKLKVNGFIYFPSGEKIGLVHY